MKKRLLCIILALILAVSLLPGATLAEAPQTKTAQYGPYTAAPVVNDGDTVTYTLNQYNSNLSSDQIWLAVNVPEDGYAFQMDFESVCSSYIYVYGANNVQTSGSPSSAFYLQNFSISQGASSRSFKAETEGVYYVLIRQYGGTYQYESSVTVTLVEGDANENNDTWDTATQLTENVDVTYTLNGGNDVDWFCITTDKPSDAMRFVFSDIDYTVREMEVTLYSARYDANGEIAPQQTGKQSITRVSENTSFRYKTTEPGVYYLRVSMYNDYYFNTKQLKLRYEIIPGDHNECLDGLVSNDTWQNATPLTENDSTLFTLNAGNDEDWFRITTTVPDDAIKVILSNFDYTVLPITAELYEVKNGNTAKLVSKENLSSVRYGTSEMSFNYKVPTPGDYYLRITPYMTYQNGNYVDTGLRLRYETVSGDSYENNDTQAKAAPYPQDGYEMEFTLNGENDVDWFYFETDTPDEAVTISLRGFETDGSNTIQFYMVYEDSGSNTTVIGSTTISHTWSTTQVCTQPGKYCICIKPYNNNRAVENTLRLKIERRAQAADGGEPNDTWENPTHLSLDVIQKFNLPGSADVDWFRFCPEKPYQTLDLHLKIPAGGGVNYAIYSESELNLRGSGSSATAMRADSYSSVGEYNVRWMLGDDVAYYVKLTPYKNSNTYRTFEEYGTITCSVIDPDEHEPNGTWQTAAALSEDVAESFTMPASNDTDFFKFTVTEKNQTVELALNHPNPSGVYLGLYSEDDYINKGDAAERMTYWELGQGPHTVRRTLENEGTYYVRLYTYSTTYFDSDATISYRLIEPDEHENNNTWDKATALSEEVDEPFTLPANNDYDWFCFTTDKNDQTVELTLNVPNGGGVDRIYLYSGTELNNKGYNNSTITCGQIEGVYSGTKTQRYMLGAADTYYIRLTADGENYVFDADATVSYRLIGTDAYERNNDWQTATVLRPQTPVTVTLPARSDYDYFKLDTPLTVGDQVTVTVSSRSDGESVEVNWRWKTENVSNLQGTGYNWTTFSPSNRSKAFTFTVNNDGDWYVYLTPYYSGKWLSQPVTVSYRVTRQNTPVTDVSISPMEDGSITLFEGRTLGLTAVITPTYASNQSVTWTSSNTAAVTIDEYGNLTAVAPGTSTVTVTTADGNKTASCTVTVAPAIRVTGVTVNGKIGNSGESEQNPKNLSLNTALQLTADVLPDTATEREVIWTVSNEEVLHVTSYGKVYAVGSGSAYVTVTTVDGEFTDSFYINVPDESYPVTRITLSENLLTLYMGEEGAELTATVHPSYATNQDIVWSSSDENIATVDENGVVTPVSVGYARITAAAAENPNGVKCTCDVSVQPERTRVTGLSFPDETIEVGIYAELDLASLLNIAPDDATVKTVTWSSSNKLVASVSRRGVVSAMNIGTATITATSDDGGHTASVTIRVSSNAAFGDVNNDGDADAGDAMLILRYNVGLIVLTDAQKLTADVNGDGEVDAGDAILVLRYDAGLIDAFPAEDD